MSRITIVKYGPAIFYGRAPDLPVIATIIPERPGYFSPYQNDLGIDNAPSKETLANRDESLSRREVAGERGESRTGSVINKNQLAGDITLKR